MGVWLFCLSLLFVCFSVQGIIVKRNTPDDDTFKVFSSREGCASVESTEPCPLSWKTSSLLSTTYSSISQTISLNIQQLNDLPGVSETCKENVKKTLCSQITPRCNEVDGSLDYGDANTTCRKIYNSCPKSLVDEYKKQNLCGTVVTGEHQKSKCVAVPNPIKGVCPQPKAEYKMPSDYLSAYEKQSENLNQTFKALEEAKIFSSDCLFKIKELYCIAFYCSSDEKYLLTEYDQEDCYDMIKSCLSSSFPDVPAETINGLKKSLKASCKVLPTSRSSVSSPLPAQLMFFILSLSLKLFF